MALVWRVLRVGLILMGFGSFGLLFGLLLMVMLSVMAPAPFAYRPPLGLGLLGFWLCAVTAVSIGCLCFALLGHLNDETVRTNVIHP